MVTGGASIWGNIIRSTRRPKEYLVTKRPARAPTHPGILLKEEVLPTVGLSVTVAARLLGVTRQTLYRIMAGTQPITPEMAVRLGKFCGNGPGLWLRMQQAYDLWQAEQRLCNEVAKIPTYARVA
jgi:addiction module HigA family antidote